MAEFKFSIVKPIGVLSEGRKGWKREMNIVKWGDGNPKYDIRDWSPDHKNMGKGVTFSEDDMDKIIRFHDEYVEQNGKLEPNNNIPDVGSSKELIED